MTPPVRLFQFPVTGLHDPAKCATTYLAIQQQGCCHLPDGGVDREDEQPEFWAVYGRNPDGTAEWIADFGNELMSWLFAAQLARILGVPVEEKGFNLAPLEAAVFMMNNQGPVN